MGWITFARFRLPEIYEWDPDDELSKPWTVCDGREAAQNAPALPPIRYRIAAYDYGMKNNILRLLRQKGFGVTVVPAATEPREVLALKPDGVFLSNGPGDPAALPYAHAAVRGLMGKKPIFGICLGHQVLGFAFGGSTFKLKFGHRGANQPVKDLRSGKVAITSQNHGFAVDPESLPADVEVSHINLNDGTVEGMRQGSANLQRAIPPRSRAGSARCLIFFSPVRRVDREQRVEGPLFTRRLRSIAPCLAKDGSIDRARKSPRMRPCSSLIDPPF